MFTTLDLVQDDVGRGLPLKGCRFAIPTGEPFIDRSFQFLGAVEGSATDHPAGDQCEEALNLVQPGTAGGSEVKMKPAPFRWFQPALDFSALVSAVVVHNEVDRQVGGQFLFPGDSENG